MFEFMKPLRAGAIGLGAAALGLAVPIAALAQSNTAAAPAATEPSFADAQIVVKDGDTGSFATRPPKKRVRSTALARRRVVPPPRPSRAPTGAAPAARASPTIS